MRKKTPTPVTVIRDSGAHSLSGAKSDSSVKFRKKSKSEPIRKAALSAADAKKQELNKKMLTAAWNGDIKKVWDLLDEGADVNARNNLGETALHLAAHGGHSETVELLLAKKAHIDAVDKEGNTALMLACCFKQTDAILVLLEKSADMGIANKNGWNAIQRLIRFARKNADIKKVLEQGVNVNGVMTRFVPTPVPKNNSENGRKNDS